jgi:hypothetical protein
MCQDRNKGIWIWIYPLFFSPLSLSIYLRPSVSRLELSLPICLFNSRFSSLPLSFRLYSYVCLFCRFPSFCFVFGTCTSTGICTVNMEMGALTFSPPAFGPSDHSTRTFRSMDTGSQKRGGLNVTVTFSPPHFYLVCDIWSTNF